MRSPAWRRRRRLRKTKHRRCRHASRTSSPKRNASSFSACAEVLRMSTRWITNRDLNRITGGRRIMAHRGWVLCGSSNSVAIVDCGFRNCCRTSRTRPMNYAYCEECTATSQLMHRRWFRCTQGISSSFALRSERGRCMAWELRIRTCQDSFQSTRQRPPAVLRITEVHSFPLLISLIGDVRQQI